MTSRNSRRPNTSQTNSLMPNLDDASTETTLLQVKKAIENININVGDITLGDVQVQSNDTTTHGLLNSLTSAVMNKHLNSGLDNVEIGSVADGIVLSTTVENFPASFQVSNFPTPPEIYTTYDSNTQSINAKLYNGNAPYNDSLKVYQSNPISGSVSVTNTSFEISNTVSTYDTNTEGINNKLYNADAPYNDCLKVYQVNPISGSVSVSNQISNYSTSALQTIGHGLLTDIKNKNLDSNVDSVTVWAGGENGLNTRNLSATVDNVDVGLSTYAYSNQNPPFPASRDVLSTQLVGVNNLAGDSLINLVSNADGHLKAEVNTISGFALESGNLASIKTNTDKIKSDTLNVDAIQVQVKNSSIPVTGNFYQASQPISGSVSVSNFPTSQAVTGTFFQATQPVSGSISVNNLPSTQAVSGSVSVSNFPTTQAVTGTFFQATQPVSGSISVNNLPSTQAVSGSVTVSNLPTTQPVSGTVNVGNLPTTQDVSGSVSVSNFPATQAVTGNFYQATQPVSGSISVNNLPSTQAVSGSVTVSNLPTTQPVSGTVSVSNLPTSTNSHTQAYDPSGGGGYFDITSTSISGSVSALDVAVKNTVPVSGTFYPATQPISGSVSVSNFPITQPVSIMSNLNVNLNDFAGNSITSDQFTFNGNLKNGLDVAVINSSSNPIPVSGNFYQATQPVSISGTVPVSGAFYQATQPVSISGTVPVSGTFYPSTQPVSGDVNARIYDTTGGSLTSTNNALNTFISNGSTTNFNSGSGINVYQILPKVKMYTFGGFDANSTANSLIIGSPTVAQVTSSTAFTFGSTMTFYAVLGVSGTKNITVEYVNENGIIVISSPILINGTSAVSLGTFKSILDFRLDSTIASGDALYIGTSSNVTTLKQTSLYYEDINQKLVGAITIPNGYIGYITNLTSQANTATNITLNRWTSLGVKSAVWRANNQGTIYINSGYEGTLGGIFTAGDTLAFSAQSAVTGKSVIANLVLKSIL
jgi:hypothetical protein